MFNDHLLRSLSRSRVEDALRTRNQSPRRDVALPPVIIRHAAASDLASLERLAALDSARIPSGELFVAEIDGRLLAATSIDTGAVIADPFEHTASIVELLRVQSRGVRRAAPRAAVVLADEAVQEQLPEAA
jgi:hypothetical protein